MTRYRPDVDGLRAIAILAVVVYHAGASWLPGGFIGVDIFFVISGYLITKIIADEIAERRFSIARFYVRRARRILPALFVVLMATMLLGAWVLTPSELAGLGKSTAATAAFVSNITFWREVGYFDVAAERKPLLHTWSLAVEEQFYLVWPLLLAFLARMRRDRLHVFAALIGLSFALSVYAAIRRPDAAFFLIPARAWELLLGAVLALGALRRAESEPMRNALAIAGLALIAFGLLHLDRDSAFPGWNALYPCVGTALLVHAGERGGHVVSRYLLTLRPMIFVGLISYSLYLWHWPLLALARITERGELPAGRGAALVLIAGALSVLTWRYVEMPFRTRKIDPRASSTLARYGLASVVVGAIGLVVYGSDGFLRLASADIARTEVARWDDNPLSGACLRWQAQTGPLPGPECTIGADRFALQWVLWGDSHADAVAPGVAAFANAHARAIRQLTMASCPPLIGARVVGPNASFAPCAAFNDRVIRDVGTAPSVDVVVLSARWTVYTEGARFGVDDSGPLTFLVDDIDREHSRTASRRVFERALGRTVDALRAAGKTVLIVGEVPELGINIPSCIARNHLPLGGRHDCSISEAVVHERLDAVSSGIDAVARTRRQVCAFHPSQVLCASGQCRGTAPDGAILYRDDDHLSKTGALALAGRFAFAACVEPITGRPESTFRRSN